jgi:glycosyltransferase involved in cell wall biosynthesis
MNESKKCKDVYIITNIAPHYREPLWLELLGCKKYNYYFYFGEIPTLGIKSIDFNEDEYNLYKDRVKYIENILINKKRIVWQRGIVWSCLSKNIKTAIFLGDLYCLSTWIASIICRIRGIDVAFWGHGLYGKEGAVKLMIKKMFFGIAQKHLLYERRAKSLMGSLGFNKNRLYVIFNSLDYEKQKKYRDEYDRVKKSDVFDFFINPELPTIVFIGRLTVEKKLELLFRSLTEINEKEVNLNLLIIGDGIEKDKLKIIYSDGIKRGWLYFMGSLYDEKEIAKYLSFSDLCVSPGNVGLTAIHSLSYGTPVCTRGDMKYQMPEAEAIVDGYNGFYFDRDNVDDLKSKIKIWFSKRIDRQVIKSRCFEVIDTYYNPHYQLKVFTQLVEGIEPDL